MLRVIAQAEQNPEHRLPGRRSSVDASTAPDLRLFNPGRLRAGVAPGACQMAEA